MTAYRTAPLAALGVAVTLLAAAVRGDDPKPAPVDLKVGDRAPAFEGRADDGTTWLSADRVGKKWVVVYFYPGDFTPGCTAQAKAFKEHMNTLAGKGVEVVGVSGDCVKTHDLFKKAHRLNFSLLADEDGAIARAFGVPFGKGATAKARDAAGKVLEVDGKPYEFARKGTAARWTFVIGKDGKVAYKNTQVTPALDAKAVAAFIAEADGK